MASHTEHVLSAKVLGVPYEVPNSGATTYTQGFEVAPVTTPAGPVYTQGFESDMDGWNAGSNTTRARSTAQARTGTQSLNFTYVVDDFSHPFVTRTFSGLTSGLTYTVSFYAKTFGGTGTAFLTKDGVDAGGGTAYTFASGWTLVSRTFVASASSHVLGIRGEQSGAAANLYVDDFTLTAGAFTTYNTDGWAGDGTNARALQDATNPHSGAYSMLHFTNSVGTRILSKTFTGLLVGRSYTFNTWHRASSTAPTWRIDVTGMTAPAFTAGTTTWTQRSATFTATATSHTINLTSSAPSNSGSIGFWDAMTLVLNPSILPDYPANLISGTIDLDDGWAPYCQASLEVYAPNQTVIEQVDPRLNLRVELTATQTFLEADSARPPVTRTFNLMLREREVDNGQGTMTLFLASDEARLQDYALVTAATERTYGLSVKTAVTYALNKIGATLEAGAADANLTTDALDPVVTNIVTNPRVGLAATNWNIFGSVSATGRVATGGPTADIPTFYRGTSTAAIAANGAGGLYITETAIPAVAGKSYTVTSWVRASAISTWQYIGQPYTAALAGVGGQQNSANLTLLANVWTQMTMTFTQPATATIFRLHLSPNVALPSGVVIDWTGVRITETVNGGGTDNSTYFDGGITSTPLYTYAWAGTAHASASIKTELPNTNATIWRPGVSAFDWITPLISAGGLRLICTEERKWILTSGNRVLESLVSVSSQTGVERGTDTVSRNNASDWYDSVVITYEWDTAEGLSMTSYDIAGTPGGRTYTETRSLPYPGPGAAAAILNRAVGKGRIIDVTSASNYAATPGMSLNITLPDTPIQTGVLSRVSWSFPEATMSIGSRGLTDTPLSAWVLKSGAWNTQTTAWNAATT